MITVMTPTYNRAYILEKAYISLKNQTSYEFEWIIVDDGSLDNTTQLVETWVKECNDFKITYVKQPNGGKHRAINRAVKMAEYDWFLILDSDDSLANYAVELIHSWIRDVSKLDGFAGVAGLRGSNDVAIGGNISKKYIDATNLERKKYNLLGDKAEIYKTEILRLYPFPEFDGENFIRESAVWDHIAKDGYKLRWYNEIIYYCEYIADGLTKNTNTETYVKNFNGFTYCTKLFLQTHRGYRALLKLGEFYKVAKKKDMSITESVQILDVSFVRFICGVFAFNLKQFIKTIYLKSYTVFRRS